MWNKLSTPQRSLVKNYSPSVLLLLDTELSELEFGNDKRIKRMEIEIIDGLQVYAEYVIHALMKNRK